MEDFEKQIKNALGRKEPPPWLESRILAAAAETRAERVPLWRWRWVAASTAAVVLVGGIAFERERVSQERAQEQRAGLAAKERLQLALKITSVKLQQIQQEVVDAK